MILRNKKIISISLFGLILGIIFFSYPPVITFDTSHYLWLANMLKPGVAFSNWDVARGIVFPAMIYISIVLLGENPIGILSFLFLFYIVMISSVALLLKGINDKYPIFEGKIKKVLLYILIVFLILLNPIIFGYYHTLLTEYVGMTIGILSCYLAWKWLEIDFENNKIKYCIYTLIFSVLTALLWHLKQPYVGTAIFPVIISTTISIFERFNLKNVIQRVITVGICVIMLFCSFILWNKLLAFGKVEIEKDRESSSFLSEGILNGISEYKNDNENEPLTLAKSIDTYIKIAVNEPTRVIKSYIKNYLGIINVLEVKFEGIVPKVTDNFSLMGTTENAAIGFRIYNSEYSNVFEVSEEFKEFADKYVSNIDGVSIVNKLMKKFGAIMNVITKLEFILLPIILIISILVRVMKKKNFSENIKYILDCCIILLSFSFLHVLAHACLGATIDRYTVPAMIPMTVAYVILGFFVPKTFERKK